MVWNAGDEVAHHILLPVRRLCTSLKVEEAHNQTDIARGPVFYCAEAADLSQPRLHVESLRLLMAQARSGQIP